MNQMYENQGIEIQTLYEYTKLPPDVLDIIYNYLCKCKMICDELRSEIIIAHKIYEIIEIYKRSYRLNVNNYEYYQYWLEHDMLLMLNDNKPLILGLSKNLRNRYPNVMLQEYLHKKVTDTKLLSCRIFKLWFMLTLKQKNQMYQNTLLINML